MKRYVSKNEFQYIIDKYEIADSAAFNIRQKIFSNSEYSDRRQLFFLKNKLTVQEIEIICNESFLTKEFRAEFITIFEVNDDLYLPTQLKNELINNEKVAVFIGAGVSKLLGYPLWNELADYSIDYLLENGFINHFEKERLKLEVKDPKQKLSIFEKFCPRASKNGTDFYKKYLLTGTTPSEAYDLIVSKNLPWTKVTSNVDYELQNALNRRERKVTPAKDGSASSAVLKEPDDFKNTVSKNFLYEAIDENKLYYLHGIVKELSETIFTIEDYLKSYYTNDSTIHKFLVGLFKNYTVVFIGYGLEEFPILEPVFRQSTKRHYMLMPIYLSEINLVNIKRRYFESLNIEIIPFYIDYKGYSRLTDVLQNWEKEIASERPLNYMDNLNLIDSVL